jgi:hypothetical protein
MRGNICGVLALVAAAGLALPVAGQVPRSRVSNVEMGNSIHAARLPYTAEYKISRVQRLRDGTVITHESTEVVAVDSHGRRMTATTSIPVSGEQTPVTRVNVFDPVARTSSNWSVPGQKATVLAMPVPGAPRQPCAAAAPASGAVGSVFTSTGPRARPTVEDLGVETIQGIEARGRVTTTTTPAGAVGNNEPLVRTSETWTAVVPGLNGLMVSSVIDDPRMGKTTRELTNLSQSEPDPSVFQPPAGYEIVSREAGGCAPVSAVIAEPAPPVPAEADSEPAAEPAPADAPAPEQ